MPADLVDAPLFRPPAPVPKEGPSGLFAFLRDLRRNPLTTWLDEHFDHLVVAGESVLGRVTVMSDPAGIRHVLVDNAANYRKDDLQMRVLAPGLGRGLLTAEGDAWRLQRRTLAPLFNPRTVTGFAPAMIEAAERVTRRWRRREGQTLDVAVEMTRVTLDVLERTIFTQGLARDPDALGRAITRFFEALGPIDPLDLFGLPGWIPRIGGWGARRAIQFFAEGVGELVENRRALIASGAPPPRDLLSLLLQAADPETGQGLSDEAVGANIVTFIGAGHETTANALSWSIYLLSQVPEARERAEREVDAVFAGGGFTPADAERLVFTRAVIEEAMRLYPPAVFINRTAIRDDRIGSLKIPRGSLVSIPPYVLHRHRRLWDEPDAFVPERFLPERRAAPDPLAPPPLRGRPRGCIRGA